MNRFDDAYVRAGGRRLVVLALITATLAMALAILGACSTATDNKVEATQEQEQVIGKPPAADEDPFFVQNMPGEAVEAAPTGSIGDDEADETDQIDKTDEDSGQGQGEGEVATRAPQESQSPEEPQCFSCVRICPTSGDCDQAKDDVICGWGVHERADTAKRLAKAECDATLDMARQMPVWSEIAGDCPTATCR
jgi:hypothetical protein